METLGNTGQSPLAARPYKSLLEMIFPQSHPVRAVSALLRSVPRAPGIR